MSWQKYDLVFRLLAPMHIGWRKTSNLQQTRGYVTGKIFWASLTARLTREDGLGNDGQAYQKIGDLVQKNFRFTYLYPATANGTGYKTHYPWDDDFDYLFLDSHTSAALNYDKQSAEDGLLHETEFVAPFTRDNRPVYLKGSMYVKGSPDGPLQKWQDALHKLHFGGERGYGWGHVRLCQVIPLPVSPVRENAVEKPEGKTVADEKGQHRLTAHLIAEKASNITGTIEPLIGWERNSGNGRAWKLSDKATICYVPGATVANTQTFTIGKYGLWQPS